MNGRSGLQLILAIGISVGGVSARANVIVGRWVEIDHCDVAAGNNCFGALGWPWVEGQHATLTHTGKVLLWKNTLKPTGTSAFPALWRAHYWDPVTTLDFELDFTGPTAGHDDANCAGHLALADGRVLVIGGWDRTVPDPEHIVGINTVWIFDPKEPEEWAHGLVKQTSAMTFDRWYPTPVNLSDGRVVVVGGGEEEDSLLTPHGWNVAEKPEIYTPYGITSGWGPPLNNAAKTDLHLYTFLHLLPGPGSNVVSIGPGVTANSQFREQDNLFKLGNLEQTSASWSEVATPADLIRGGSHIRYARDKILKTGGLPADSTIFDAVASAEVITINLSNGSIASIAPTDPMLAARTEHNLTVLPDGTVLATGGYSREDRKGPADSECQYAVYTTELWDPVTGHWSAVDSMTHRNPDVPRMYHSTAVLMPDGRVLSSGGECLDLSTPNTQDGCPEGHNTKLCMSADYYEPPYLFKNVTQPITDDDRPDVDFPLESLAYGETYVSLVVDTGKVQPASQEWR